MTSILAKLVAMGAPLLGLVLWVWLAQAEQGERYIKQRMQGPFVPLDERRSGIKEEPVGRGTAAEPLSPTPP